MRIWKKPSEKDASGKTCSTGSMSSLCGFLHWQNAGKTSFLWLIFFLKLTCAKAHKSFRGFDRLAEAALLEYPWPGNIRELKNVIGRAVLICQEQWISVSDLNLEISLPKEEETQWTEEEKEKALLLQTLEKTGDNRSKAARLLNVSRTTLYEKLRKYHIID